MKPRPGPRPLPAFKTDEEAERFVDTADLTDYDLSGFEPAEFEFLRKTASIHLRLSDKLLDAIKKRAAKLDMPYQRLIRQALENEVRKDR